MEKKEIEIEFSEFLIQKIENAGGSLPFHYLFGLLRYGTFEMRKEFGSTKHELRKFLEAHSETFCIDSSRMVTVISSFPTVGAGSNKNKDKRDDKDVSSEEIITTKNIENGVGYVDKLYPDFGIIKAFKPLETKVYFKPDVFSGNQDKLLIECLEIKSKVGFNAVYGQNDFDIKFLATKVWSKEKVNVTDIDENQEANDFEGDGVVHKIFADAGYILVSGKKKEIVFFHKNSVIDRKGIELANFFKVGDPVSFSASISNERNPEYQWQAIVVRKKVKEKAQSKSHTKTKAAFQNRIENEVGKIYPHSHGAIIKFRNNELADGDSSYYFYHGMKVKDIAFEFSEGDDVFFDAHKTKSAPGWKAECVWVGEKPEYSYRKIESDEEIQGMSDNSNSSNQKKNHTMSLKSKTLKYEGESPSSQQSPVVNHDVKYKRQNYESHGNSRMFLAEKSYKGEKTKPRNKIESIKKNKSHNNEITSERPVKPRSNPRNLTVNRQKNTTMELNMEINHTSSHMDDCLSYKDEDSDTSEKRFLDVEFQDILQKGENFLRERCFGNEYQSDSESDESDIDNADEITHYNSFVRGKPCIKTFEDIEGEIVILHCKVAIVKSSKLQENVNFLLNDFYINGKSVEEQQVIDLKEILKVGDLVNINCFEIIDDLGRLHHKVTLAWKGSKPNVHEITPKEFIDELGLSVTVSGELVPEYLPEEKKSSQNSVEETSEEIEVIEHGPANFSNGISDMQINQYTKIAETDKHNYEENNLPIDSHELLSEMIIHRLKSKGLISADLQVDFSDILTQIISLTQHSDINSYKNIMNEENVQQNVCSTCAGKRDSPFSFKNKSEKHVGVQTIITGGIIAQSIYTKN